MLKTLTPTIGCFISNSFIIQITFSLDRFVNKFLSQSLDLIIPNILRIIVTMKFIIISNYYYYYNIIKINI